MKDMMRYKDYYGSVHFSDEDNIFYGRVEFVRALVSYEGTDVATLRQAFQEAVDDYLQTCTIRHMREVGSGHIQAALRDGTPVTAATIYLSNFKEYNEANGYQRGEFVLQKVADLLKGQEVMGAVPGRCFGATFLVFYPGKSREQGQYLLDRFLKDLSAFSFYGEKKVQAGRIVVDTTLAEYDRSSGATFDDFFASLEGQSAG